MNEAYTLFPRGLAGLIYDCDGVMIDSRSANTLFYNRVLAYFGLAPMTPEQEQYSFKATGMQALQAILPPRLHPEIAYVVHNEVIYERDIVPLLKLMPGFTDFVLEMNCLGFKQAMCTNRTDAGFEDVLTFFSFPRLFDPIMTVTKVEPKPSPAGALAICRAWEVQPEDVLFVGDSSHDQDAAGAAGIPFAAFNAINCQGVLTAQTWPELRRQLAPFLDTSVPL